MPAIRPRQAPENELSSGVVVAEEAADAAEVATRNHRSNCELAAVTSHLACEKKVRLVLQRARKLCNVLVVVGQLDPHQLPD